MVGNKYNRLTVVSFSHNRPRKGAVYNCLCDCGKTSVVLGSNLRCNAVKSCGCLRLENTKNKIPYNFVDISGWVYGKLTVIKRVQSSYNTKWLCRCECGNETVVDKGNLSSGRQVSCGCHNRLMAKNGHTIHNKSKTPIYRVWSGMITRCYNPKFVHYKDYGGRGITVCDEWRNDFMVFYNDMYEGYKKGLELDRVEVNGNYEKKNCRWATQKENARNKRNTFYLTVDGNTKPLSQWAEEQGTPYHSVYKRAISVTFTPKQAVFGKITVPVSNMSIK